MGVHPAPGKGGEESPKNCRRALRGERRRKGKGGDGGPAFVVFLLKNLSPIKGKGGGGVYNFESFFPGPSPIFLFGVGGGRLCSLSLMLGKKGIYAWNRR